MPAPLYVYVVNKIAAVCSRISKKFFSYRACAKSRLCFAYISEQAVLLPSVKSKVKEVWRGCEVFFFPTREEQTAFDASPHK